MKKTICIALIFFVLFFIIYIYICNTLYENIYDKIQKESEILLNGVIQSEGVKKEYKTVYTIEVKSGEYKNKKLLLNVKKDIYLQYGDLIKIKGKIEIGEQARNYKGFDYRRYLKTKNIIGIVSVKNPDIQVLAHEKVSRMNLFLHNINFHIQEKFKKVLPQESAALCIAFLIGERSEISEEISTYFRNSNLTHMLAISGMHISYIILILGKSFSLLGKKSSRILTILFLLIFMALTGFTPSVTRASIMAIMLLLANLLHRKSNTYINLSIATILILIANPYSIFDLGFQLSFGGTIGILICEKKIEKYFYKKIEQREKESKLYKIRTYIYNIIIVTLSANLIILPIIAIQFHTISFTFIISNLLAAPLIGILILGGFLLYFVSIIFIPLANAISIPYNFLVQIFIKVAEYTGEIPFSTVLIPRIPIPIIIIYYIIVICILYKKEITSYFKRNRTYLYIENICIYKKYLKKHIFKSIIIITILLLILSYFLNCYLPRKLRIHFIDVGQGDCTLIRTPMNTNILIDGGGSENSSFDVGEKILLPYLLSRGITHLDYILISHFDSDHVRLYPIFIAENKSKKYYNRQAI